MRRPRPTIAPGGVGPPIARMNAAWYDRTGPARDVLVVGTHDVPEPGAGDVRVRVHASGVNPSDTKRRAGWIGLEMPHPRIIPHSDGAGVIDRVGDSVDPGRVGERVWVWNAQSGARPFGTAAEYVVVPETQAVPLPENVEFGEGAGLGVPGCTAHYAVYGDGPVGGKTLLIHAGAGAVGHLAVQLAALGGATVISTVSGPDKARAARDAGAHHVVNYREDDVAACVLELTDGRGVDRVVEVDLAANLETNTKILVENGSIASYSSTSGPQLAVDYYPLAFKDIRIHFLQGYLLPPAARRAAIRDLNMWLTGEQLMIRIGARFSLPQVALAHEALESGDVLGKVIVDVP